MFKSGKIHSDALVAKNYKNSSLGSASNYQRKGENMFIVLQKRRDFYNYFHVHNTCFHVSNFENIHVHSLRFHVKDFEEIFTGTNGSALALDTVFSWRGQHFHGWKSKTITKGNRFVT